MPARFSALLLWSGGLNDLATGGKHIIADTKAYRHRDRLPHIPSRRTAASEAIYLASIWVGWVDDRVKKRGSGMWTRIQLRVTPSNMLQLRNVDRNRMSGRNKLTTMPNPAGQLALVRME